MLLAVTTNTPGSSAMSRSAASHFTTERKQMSTEFILHEDDKWTVTICEVSAAFCLDLDGYYEGPDYIGAVRPYVCGPQHMTAEEALKMAAIIIYAVWCSYPDEAEALAAALNDNVPRGASKA
jgi:hypothetical protein